MTQLSVGLVLVNGQKSLWQLRDNKPNIALPNYWSIPGGRVEDGEDVEGAIKREFKEETGYILKSPKLFKVETYVFDGKEIKRHLFYEIYDGRQKVNCFEGQKMEFKSPAEFKGMKIFPSHTKFVIEALKLVAGTPPDD